MWTMDLSKYMHYEVKVKKRGHYICKMIAHNNYILFIKMTTLYVSLMETVITS